MKTRHAWIDIAKGIGILLVVIAHVFEGPVRNFIFMFHMPFFFLIAGRFFSVHLEKREYLYKRIVQLLIPYTFFLVLLTIPEILPSIRKYGMSCNLIKPYIFGGTNLIGTLGAFWFITVLFASQQILNFLCTLFSQRTTTFIVFLFLLLAYFPKFQPNLSLPGNFKVVYMAIPLLYIGYRTRDIRIEKWLPLFYGVTIGGILLFVFGRDNFMDMKSADYGIPLITLACSIAMYGIILHVSKVLERSLEKSLYAVIILQKAGEASMLIMFLHQVIQINLLKYGYISNDFLRCIIAFMVPLGLYQILNKFSFTRMLMLGSVKDFNSLFSRRSAKNI